MDQSGPSGLIDCHNHIGVELSRYLRGEYPYCQDLRTLFINADRTGVDRCIVFPSVSYQAMNLVRLRESKVELDGRLDAVPYGRENRRLMREVFEFFPALAPRVFPFVNVDPGRMAKAQIVLLRQLRTEYRFVGLKIQPFAVRSPIRTLLTEGAPFIEFAREHNLPILIHASIGAEDPYSNCGDILEVVRRHPDVRFCLAHSCRFHRPSLDAVGELANAWFDCSAHGIHCQLAAEDHPVIAAKPERFAADFRDPGAVLCALAEAYPDKLMWGTDSPAHSFVAAYDGGSMAMWSTYDLEVGYARRLPPALLTKVAEKNTLAFLGGNAGHA